MDIVASIVIPFAVSALLTLIASKTIYNAGRTAGTIDCMSRLSMEGEALLLTCPYDMIDEEYAERMRKFLLLMKKEHDKSKINRRIYDDEGDTCYRQAEGWKLECRGPSGSGEDTD